jgi:hypothetical protein
MLLPSCSQLLHSQWGAIPPVAPGWWGCGLTTAAGGAWGLGGQEDRGMQKLIVAALCSLPPGRQLCPTQGRLIAVAKMAAPSPPLLLLWGLLPVADQWAFAAGKGQWCSGSAVLGGNPNNVPCAKEAPRPWQTLWLSSEEWVPLIFDKEEVVATMAATMTSCWRQQQRAVDGSKRAGGRKRRIQ